MLLEPWVGAHARRPRSTQEAQHSCPVPLFLARWTQYTRATIQPVRITPYPDCDGRAT